LRDGSSSNAVTHAFIQADAFDKASAPYAHLKRHLVPTVLTPKMFYEKFGTRAPTKTALPARAELWRRSLEQIKQSTMEREC
jgi:hypothetical protein